MRAAGAAGSRTRAIAEARGFLLVPQVAMGGAAIATLIMVLRARAAHQHASPRATVWRHAVSTRASPHAIRASSASTTVAVAQKVRTCQTSWRTKPVLNASAIVPALTRPKISVPRALHAQPIATDSGSVSVHARPSATSVHGPIALIAAEKPSTISRPVRR